MRGKKFLAMLIVITMMVTLVPTVAFATTTNVASEAELRAALASNITDITITRPIYIEESDNLEIPAGTTVTIADSSTSVVWESSGLLTVDGKIILADGGYLAMRNGSGGLTVNGEITTHGTLSVNSELVVNENGVITVQDGGTLSKLSGSGEMTVKGAITVQNGGLFNIDALSNVEDGGSITVNEGGDLTIKSDGQLNINSGAILDVNGTLDITDGAYLIVSGGGTATVSGTATIDGTLQVDGTLTAESGTTVESSGTRKISVKNTVYWLADAPTMKLFVLGDSSMLYSTSDLSSNVAPDEGYAITLKANDGTFDKGTIYAYTSVYENETIRASIPTPTRSGNYSFGGWSDGTKTYSTAELQALIFTDDTSVTFDAVWRSATPPPSYGTLSVSTSDNSAFMIKSGDTILSSNVANFSITTNALSATYNVALTDSTRLITGYEIIGEGVTVAKDATNPATYNITVTNAYASSSVVFSTAASSVDITLVNATITGKTPLPATAGQDENTLVYTVVSGETVDIVADNPAVGKYFDGWTVTGDATLLNNTATLTKLTVSNAVKNNITVTAVYKEYTITFNSGNVDNAMLPAEYTGTTYTQTMNNGTATKLNPNLYTADGYIFLGWTLTDGASTADTLISDEALVTFTENTNLYAYWMPNKDITDILTTEVSNNSFVTDNLDDLEIVIEELEVENLVKVLLGSVDITAKVVVEAGGLITVPAEVLEGLSAGEHELRIETIDGYILQTITILDETSPTTDGIPETNENTSSGFVVVVIALLVIGLGCVLFIVLKKRTNK